MRLYSSSRGKSNRCKSRSELQMFSLISGGHVCAQVAQAPKGAVNMTLRNSVIFIRVCTGIERS